MMGKTIKPYEVEVLTKTGETLPFEVNASKIKYKGTKADLVIFRDLSDRKKAEDELKESNDKYSTLVESATDGVIIIQNDKLQFCNDAMSTITGYTTNELIGMNFIDLIPDQNKELLYQRYIKRMQGEKVIPHYESQIIRKNNEIKNIEISANIITFQGKPADMAIIHDITKRKQNELELKKAHHQLQELNNELEKKVEERTLEIKRILQLKDDFINQLGHDLKSPLNPLINLLPLFEEKETDPKYKEMMNVLLRNTEYMKNLVTKTIELAKLNSPNTAFNIEQIDLSKTINFVLENNKILFKENNIQIQNNLTSNIFLYADRLRIQELFTNLFNNSVKYTKESGTITIDAFDNENMITISIRDTGLGMTKEQLTKIFNEFYKADASRHDFDSSGLGLPICKRIVERHGGKIWVNSEGLGKGTTFYFSLPRSIKD
jgi:PAS domain S-box-containing protein